MDAAPPLLSIVNQLLVAFLIVVAAALFIIVHRKNLLALLVDKQSELIDKLRNRMPSSSKAPGEQGLAHLRDTAKWLQARYRRDYAYDQKPPQQVSNPEQLQKLLMAVVMQTLSKEFQATREQLDPEATWAEMQGVLNELLAPTYLSDRSEAGDEALIEAVPEPEPEDTSNEQLSSLEEQLQEERAQRRKLERELSEMQALYQRLLDEVAEQMAAIPAARTVAEWLASRRDGLGSGSKAMTAAPGSEVGELSRKALAESLQKSEAEMKTLRNALAGQHELVTKLKYKMAQPGQAAGSADSEELPPELMALERMLRESETCIKTLEMDLEDTHARAKKLEQEVAALRERLAAGPAAPESSEAPREVKELTATIKTLEHAAEEQSQEMAALRKALEQEKNLNFILRDQLGMAEPVAETGKGAQEDSEAEPSPS
ncbi:MAG: hypothetical protein DWQ09_08100 [Proteobacteria bacterium]|nr:MAG: hypothetical protein DWQ09_08100 [Pseudomonadota bacterium]